MDAEKPSGSSGPDAKRRIRSDERSPSRIAAVEAPAAVVTNVEQTGDIFKLDIDCFEESFDYLPMKDLANVGKTCKRLHQVAGYCFQQNYSGDARCDEDGIKSKWDFVDIKHFSPFVQRIEVNESGLQYFFDLRSKLQRLKKIEFDSLKTAAMDRLKEIPLDKVEILSMFGCDLSNFHGIMEQCVELKRLDISYCDGEINLVDRKYPKLEYLKLDSTSDSVEGIAMFLSQNPNIRKFTTYDNLLLANRDAIMNANVKLDVLTIEMDISEVYELKSMRDWLNELYQRGFYSKLQLYFSSISKQGLIDQLVTFNGLVKLYVQNTNILSSRTLAIPALQNLQELGIGNLGKSKTFTDFETLAINLINLNRIYFKYASIDDIMPFIRRSVKMKRIKVDDLQSGVHFNEDTEIIDLLALNREREKLAFYQKREYLPDTQKITLYVVDQIYLATKWAMKGNDFELIRLKREESFDWGHEFDYY